MCGAPLCLDGMVIGHRDNFTITFMLNGFFAAMVMQLWWPIPVGCAHRWQKDANVYVFF
jgi:hypothetical protein